ncbi:MAG: hypothetical protein AAGA27_00170 [Pseudomonadota bacterium]
MKKLLIFMFTVGLVASTSFAMAADNTTVAQPPQSQAQMQQQGQAMQGQAMKKHGKKAKMMQACANDAKCNGCMAGCQQQAAADQKQCKKQCIKASMDQLKADMKKQSGMTSDQSSSSTQSNQ